MQRYVDFQSNICRLAKQSLKLGDLVGDSRRSPLLVTQPVNFFSQGIHDDDDDDHNHDDTDEEKNERVECVRIAPHIHDSPIER